ncbi:AurF N-oxygenase family protein [Sporichthya polymorpha]|uniref:AurF N-oxygenase family protein n=1 Tax=Sporichthya polymorpha TaxID=35751 RepID=UPI0003A0B253|nr:diiron oxygenase [Sporichthya polymorpha]
MTPPLHPLSGTELETRREHVAGRLLESSARHSFDPVTEVGWDAPLVDDLPYMPFERMSLYGTELWEGLTHSQRVELSKHEFASGMQVGLWFELILMQLLARYAYDLDPRSRHAQYALTELGDETRHSIMFARAADKLGVPHYKPARLTHELSRLAKATMGGPSMFGAVLVAEETTDRMQRAMMDDENIQPLMRQVNRIHVIEEARHVRFARDEVVHRMAGMNPVSREFHRHVCAVISYMIIDSMIDPRVYASVGIAPREGRAAALANPHYQDTRRWMAEKITAFLRENGLIGGPSTAIWKRAYLI